MSNDYMNWSVGHPNQSAHSCVVNVRTTGFNFQWQSADCASIYNGSAHHFFCQINACDTDNYCTDIIHH